MKSAIVYYSYSGNTRQVAQYLQEYLQAKTEVELIELKALDESSNFFKQCQRAAFKKEAQLGEVKKNLAGFDIICFGTPVWAFGPAPAMNAYLKQCEGCQGKTAVIFTTYGSGTGNARCLRFMQDALERKGVKTMCCFSVQQGKVKNREYLSELFKNVL